MITAEIYELAIISLLSTYQGIIRSSEKDRLNERRVDTAIIIN